MSGLEEKEQSKRIGWHKYFMSVAHLISKRSTCKRRRVGAVIVRDNNILATGYNGSPVGLPHCDGVNCLIYTSTHPNGNTEENCMRTIHAELNAIVQAAKHGTAINKASIYVTVSPCVNCVKVLINVGIRIVYYQVPYKVEYIQDLIEEANMKFIQVHGDH